MDLTPKMTAVKEADFQSLVSLHARDIVSLVAVIMGVQPMATLVIPLNVYEWFREFSDRHSLISFEDGPSDSYQARVAVCRDEETAESRKALKRIRSLVDEAARNAAISRENEAYRSIDTAHTWSTPRLASSPSTSRAIIGSRKLGKNGEASQTSESTDLRVVALLCS